MTRAPAKGNGWAEILVTGTLFPGLATYTGDDRAFVKASEDENFAPPVVSANPGAGDVGLGGRTKGGLFAVILKFAVVKRVVATGHRNVPLLLGAPLVKGTTLSFHADADCSVRGVLLDLEMQVALRYSIS